MYCIDLLLSSSHQIPPDLKCRALEQVRLSQPQLCLTGDTLKASATHRFVLECKLILTWGLHGAVSETSVACEVPVLVSVRQGFCKHMVAIHSRTTTA
jgi:hypothetical protein